MFTAENKEHLEIIEILSIKPNFVGSIALHRGANMILTGMTLRQYRDVLYELLLALRVITLRQYRDLLYEFLSTFNV